MAVLHFINSLDMKSLPCLFLSEMLKGKGNTDISFVLAMSMAPEFEELKDKVKVGLLSGNVMKAAADWKKIKDFAEDIHPDIIHIHSINGRMAWMAYRFAVKNRIPYVVSTCKEFMDWNFHYRYATRKLPLFLLFQHRMLKDAAALHFMTTQEEERMNTLSWHPAIKAKKALNCKGRTITYAKMTDSGTIDCDRVNAQMQQLYRKVADSNPFMLMSIDDRRMENELLALGVALAKTEGDENKIFLPLDSIRDRAQKLKEENWRLIQLHSDSQGILQTVVKAMEWLVPGKGRLQTNTVDRFDDGRELVFLETARAHIRVSRTRQLCDSYSRYTVEKKICIMLLNLKLLIDKGRVSRKNIADMYAVLRFENYNEYVLNNMLDEIGMKKFFRRIIAVLNNSMLLEEGFMAMDMNTDRTEKHIEAKLFKSNIQ